MEKFSGWFFFQKEFHMKPARYVFRCKQLKLQHNTLAVITGEATPKSRSLELGTCGAYSPVSGSSH